MRQPPAIRRGLFAFLVVVVVLAGCGRGAERTAGTPPPPTGVRHDLEPLTSRYPALGEPVSASWVTWNSSRPGDRSVPGPTTYWIHAVVLLSPTTTTELATRYLPRPEGKRPDVQDLLRPEVPEGPFLTGAALDRAFTTPDLSGFAYLDPVADAVVVMSAGQ
jgi:hypothetical protein